MVDIDTLMRTIYFGNTLAAYVRAVIIFIASFILLKLFRRIAFLKLKRMAEKTKTDVDNILVRIVNIGSSFFLFVAAYVAVRSINTLALIQKIIGYIILAFVIYYIIRGLQILIDYAKTRIIRKRIDRDSSADTSHIDFLAKVAKVLLWVFALLFVLSNLGYNINTLLAGMGIGGIAIAFALQNVLADIFASISIFFDKPFVVGDFIIIGDDMGIVKKIGIKSTRIQTLEGQELVVSNKELTETRVNNYKKMEKRRVVFKLGVTYETPVRKLQKIPGLVKGIIEKVELAEFDRAHFKSYGDFSLVFETVYYINSSDYTVYMDVQQQINLEIKTCFEKQKIDMAYPTQTVFVKR